ncbi:hypothetical protein CWI36_1582p0010 [Hamiltosporidium magnivora]|uniref:Uncharacterized protein n=1 Tax=Hamiltosporidium magnivora TaxID=148818 RepID=A0A4Q9KZY1_9MICR|nr:hypothetical protein CWI36_1582p0010 [Hamiltosporidium magnivora]
MIDEKDLSQEQMLKRASKLRQCVLFNRPTSMRNKHRQKNKCITRKMTSKGLKKNHIPLINMKEPKISIKEESDLVKDKMVVKNEKLRNIGLAEGTDEVLG